MSFTIKCEQCGASNVIVEERSSDNVVSIGYGDSVYVSCKNCGNEVVLWDVGKIE